MNREVKLDNLRKVMVKIIGQNYFVYGKGHTDEQDKAFIADFMAFAGKDSLLAKPMVEQYHELRKSEAKTASGKAAPDITLQTRDDFGLSAAFNIAYNKNEVVKVDHTPASGFEALRTLREGDPVNAIYAYRFAGMQTDESGMQSYGWYDAKGNIHTTDIASGEFAPEDIVCMGGRDPKVTASFVPELTWKGFSLSAMLAYYGGHYMNAAAEDWVCGGTYRGYGNIDDPVPAAFLNYWQAADKTSAIANGYPGMNTIGISDYIDQTVMHADYLKVRNIVLGYNFPKMLCGKLGINALRIRLQMNNVATWKRNSMGIDPEAVDPLSGYAVSSPMRSYTMSVSVNL